MWGVRHWALDACMDDHDAYGMDVSTLNQHHTAPPHPTSQLDKARAVLEQQPQEREEFERYVEGVAGQTAAAEQEIGALKEALAVARAVRQQREEYEAMAKLVNEYPAEAVSYRARAALEAEAAALDEEEARLREALAFRRRQLAFVVNAVADLRAGVEYDLRVENERERYVAEREKEAQQLQQAAAGGGGGGGGGGESVDGEGAASMDQS